MHPSKTFQLPKKNQKIKNLILFRAKVINFAKNKYRCSNIPFQPNYRKFTDDGN